MFAYPYAQIYAKRVWGLSDSDAGYFIIAQQVGQLATVLVFGFVSDRVGNRRIMIFTSWLYVLIPILCLLMPLAPGGGVFWLFVPAFTLMGVAHGGLVVGTVYFPLELAPEKRRPIYLAVVMLLTLPVTLFPALAGLLLRHVDYQGLFYIMAIAAVFSLAAAWSLQEPRQGLKMVRARGENSQA